MNQGGTCMACVKRIYKKTSNKGSVDSVESVELVEGHGVAGNPKPKKAHWQVSLIASESRVELFQKNAEGFCLKKFTPDLVIEGVVISDLAIGMKLIIGDTLHEVTELGKKCHADCPIKVMGGVCPLRDSVLYTCVIRSGNVKIGDRIQF